MRASNLAKPLQGSRAALFALAIIAGMLIGGCNKKPETTTEPMPPVQPAPSGNYFKTQFQNESQYIIEAILSDLAEQMYFAAQGRLPDAKQFLVEANEKPGGTIDAPIYDVRVRLDPTRAELKTQLNINGRIWSPEIYEQIAAQIAQVAGLKAGERSTPEDGNFLGKFIENLPGKIEEEDQKLSGALEQDFTNAEWHEEAAMLLGAFLLRDHSGYFFEIRSPLSRMTAHLVMARFLRGKDYGVNGRMADAVSLTLTGNEAASLERLKSISLDDKGAAAFVRALQTRNTGDFRPLDNAQQRTPLESVEWFSSMADYADTDGAWLELDDDQKANIDFVRAMGQMAYSVGVGHELLATAGPLELEEIRSIFKLSRQRELDASELVSALNAPPDGCFAASSDGKVHVRVIGWGQWANFLQRHLCHAIQHNYYFMRWKWGVPDEAKKFAASCEQAYGGLRLYPFVRRYSCSDVDEYHESVDEGFKVTVSTPQFTPAACWNIICDKVSFAPWYRPNPNPHVNEWHKHNPPPGTLYDLNARLNHPSLVQRGDVLAKFEQLHALAPYDTRISCYVLDKKYTNHPTYEQTVAMFNPVLPYSTFALATVAKIVHDRPEEYKKWMEQAGDLNPSYYYTLGDYFLERGQRDEGSRYIEKACAGDTDVVRISNHAVWRVEYFMEKGQTEKARKIADEGGEVYSFRGLEAKGTYFELTSNYDAAFDWFRKLEERYSNSYPVIDFCLRYKAKVKDGHFDSELKQRVITLFPKGIEKVSASSFQGPPRDGVVILQENDTVRSNGLKAGNVIVAVYGVRVHDMRQYSYGRELKDTPELDLIVWQGDAYREFKPNLPTHRFGVDFDTYAPKK